MKFEFDYYPGDVDETAPLLYYWEVLWSDGTIDDYVGQSKPGSKRARKHYRRNVARMEKGLPYRSNKPGKDFRRVHKAMHKALATGTGTLRLTLICNTTLDEINALESAYIKDWRPSLND